MASNIPAKKPRTLILKWAVSLWLACIFVSPELYGETVVDRIVAQVNDDIITLSDLEQAIEPFIEQIKTKGLPPVQEQEMLYKVRTEMLDELIANKLTDQVVREKGISISEKDVDNAIEDIKRKNFLTQEQFLVAIKKEGDTLEEYRRGLREQMLRHRLLTQEIQSKIVVTTEDVEAYYKEHSDKYGGKQKYYLRSIIKRIPQFADEKKIESIIGTMKDIIRKVDNGESFSELAKEHSDLLAEEGGDIGQFELNQLSEEIRNAIKDLKVGGHTPIMNTAQGLQIFYLQEIVQTEGTPIASVSDEINEILYKKVLDDKFKEWVSGLREKAHIKIIQ